MEFTPEQKRIVQRLSYGAGLFRSYYHRDSSFSQQFGDNYQALICFLENYAYERQGAAPAYPRIAVKALRNRFRRGIRSVSVEDAEAVWEDYQEIAKDEFNNLSVNKTHNPMSSDNGLLRVMATHNISNLAVHVEGLLRQRKTKTAHGLIHSIRGIGTKIASLYIRDIAYLGKLSEEEIEDQYYLQPVDTWIEQALSIILGNAKPKALREEQEIIVELCIEAKVSPIAFSQGAWILGSQVAGDYSTFEQLAKGQNARAIIEEHIRERESYVLHAERWIKDWPG